MGSDQSVIDALACLVGEGMDGFRVGVRETGQMATKIPSKKSVDLPRAKWYTLVVW